MSQQDDKTAKSIFGPQHDSYVAPKEETVVAPAPKEETAPVAKKPAKGDDLKTRILTAMGVTFPASRDAEVQEVHSISGGLSVAEVAYSPSTDTSAETAVLVFDNGKSVYLWPCQ